MYCTHCGSKAVAQAKFCAQCGQPYFSGNSTGAQNPHVSYQERVGFSDRILDPAFSKYVKSANLWAAGFALFLALAAVIGFFIYGETSYEMDNPQALYIGFGIGGMFLLIALFQILGRKSSKTWDGTVVDKRVEHKSHKRYDGNNNYYWEEYMQYVVQIRGERGQKKELIARDDDTQYHYYRVGDRVRHHGGLNSFEKYDKTGDTIIFCNACATKNPISSDTCFRCSCPLLK